MGVAPRERDIRPCLVAAGAGAAPEGGRMGSSGDLCGFLRLVEFFGFREGPLSSEQEFSGEQSRQIAALIREEIARRRMSRQQLADKAKLSLSTLEKVLGGRRPLTLATAVRVEEALGVSLRRSAPEADAPLKDGVAPDGLGAYSRRGATWLEGVYVTVRPSFGDKGAIYAYRTEILWDEPTSRLVFREAERVDAEFSQYGEVAVPNQSGHIYLVTNRHGQHRLITVSRPMISGEMYGVIATLLAGRGSMLTPIAAPIALLPVKNVPDAAYGRIAAGDARGALYREHLQRVTSDQFAMFLP
jgi:transcriptional regulator with XRE-family HTH domain